MTRTRKKDSARERESTTSKVQLNNLQNHFKLLPLFSSLTLPRLSLLPQIPLRQQQPRKDLRVQSDLVLPLHQKSPSTNSQNNLHPLLLNPNDNPSSPLRRSLLEQGNQLLYQPIPTSLQTHQASFTFLPPLQHHHPELYPPLFKPSNLNDSYKLLLLLLLQKLRLKKDRVIVPQQV